MRCSADRFRAHTSILAAHILITQSLRKLSATAECSIALLRPVSRDTRTGALIRKRAVEIRLRVPASSSPSLLKSAFPSKAGGSVPPKSTVAERQQHCSTVFTTIIGKKVDLDGDRAERQMIGSDRRYRTYCNGNDLYTATFHGRAPYVFRYEGLSKLTAYIPQASKLRCKAGL
eukprot:IDg7158t1